MAFATMPNSCELRDTQGRSWAVQVKPVGAGAEEYQFVPGLTGVTVSVTTTGTDATTIDMDGWTTETKTSRNLTVTLNGNYKRVDGLDILTRAQQLLSVSGEELGPDGQVDLRVWRTDVDYGWESTFNNQWEGGAGDATGLWGFTSTLQSSCAPTRIHSVDAEGVTDESDEVDQAEYLSILEPAGAPAGGGDEPGE